MRALVHPRLAQELAEQLQQVVNDDLLWGASNGSVVAARWLHDQGVHHDASVVRSHGQLGDDLDLWGSECLPRGSGSVPGALSGFAAVGSRAFNFLKSTISPLLSNDIADLLSPRSLNLS